MRELFSRVVMTAKDKSMRVTEFPTDGIYIESIIMEEEGIVSNRMALSSDSAKVLLEILKEWEAATIKGG